MPLTPDERQAIAARFRAAAGAAHASAKGGKPLGGADAPALGSFAEDAPAIQGDPSLDPTREPWWGRESD
jgi:hypothetical protein